MSGRVREILRTLIAGAALLVAAGGAVAVLAPARAQPTFPSSFGQVGGVVAAFLLLAAAGLVAAGTVAWFGRPAGILALIGFGAAAAWLAPELAGSPSVTREARSLGLLLAPLAVPLLVHFPLRTVRADAAGGRTRWLVICLYAAMTTVAIGRSLTWDPFWELDCAPVCRQGDNVLVLWVDVRLAGRLTAAGLLITVVSGLALAGWSILGLLRRRHGRARSQGVVLMPAAAVGVTVAWSATSRLVVAPEQLTDPWLLAPICAASAAIVGLGIGVAWFVSSEARRDEGLRRLAEVMDQADGPRSLRATLAATLGDPMLRVAYPVGRGTPMVDETGEPVDDLVPARGRALTGIERDGEVVAVVEHDSGLDVDVLTSRIGAAARLAVDNERLEAALRAHVRELQASRSRIVEAGDATRGQLERDLHDGAQQRLLAVSYELRLAQASAVEAGDEQWRRSLDHAVDELDRVLVALRELAHGIHPAVLREAGLEGALRSLAEQASIPLVLGDLPDGRCPTAVETAAYVTVAEALRLAEAAGVARVDAAVRRLDGTLSVDVAAPGLEGRRWYRVEDRVGAAGGQTRIATDAAGATLVSVELPCV